MQRSCKCTFSITLISIVLITSCTVPQPSRVESGGVLQARQICPQPAFSNSSITSENLNSKSDTPSVIRAYGGISHLFLQGRHNRVRNPDGAIVLGANISGYGYYPNTYDFALIKVLPDGSLGWAKSMGGPENDFTDAIITARDKGYLITGTAIQKEPPAITGLGKGRLLVVKSDKQGVLEWQKVYVVSNEPNDLSEEHKLHGEIDSIVEASDGGYVIAGSIAEDYGSPYRHWDILVAKFDISGNVEWATAIGGKGKDVSNEIIQTNDGGYALVGVTYPTGISNSDIAFVKLDSNGQVELSRSYAGPRQDNGLGIIQEADGSFVIGGWARPQKLRSGHDILLMKINSVGEMLWAKGYDSAKYPTSAFGQETEYFNEYPGKGKHMRNSYDSFSLLNTDDFGFAITALISKRDNVFVLKTDDKGNLDWVRTKRVEEDGWGYAQYSSDIYGLTIDQNSKGEYMITGNVRDPNARPWIFTWQFGDSSPIEECMNEINVRTVVPPVVEENPDMQSRRVYLVSDNGYKLTQADISLERITP